MAGDGQPAGRLGLRAGQQARREGAHRDAGTGQALKGCGGREADQSRFSSINIRG